jgi:hypothetical protein
MGVDRVYTREIIPLPPPVDTLEKVWRVGKRCKKKKEGKRRYKEKGGGQKWRNKGEARRGVGKGAEGKRRGRRGLKEKDRRR